jgi:hypothetical protein
MTIGKGIFAFDLALPFENGGMDASGFTVAPGTAQGRRLDVRAPRWTGHLATCLWIGVMSVLAR